MNDTVSSEERTLRELQEEIIRRRDHKGLTQHDRDVMADQANAIETVLAQRDEIERDRNENWASPEVWGQLQDAIFDAIPGFLPDPPDLGTDHEGDPFRILRWLREQFYAAESLLTQERQRAEGLAEALEQYALKWPCSKFPKESQPCEWNCQRIRDDHRENGDDYTDESNAEAEQMCHSCESREVLSHYKENH